MSPAIVDVLVDVVRAVIEDLGLAVVGPKSHVLVKYCCSPRWIVATIDGSGSRHHTWCSHEGRRRHRARADTWPLGAGRISAEAVLLVRKIRSVVDGNLVARCDGLRQHQDRLTHRCRTVVAVRIPSEDRVCLFARLVIRVNCELCRNSFTVHLTGVRCCEYLAASEVF